jgi:hypothetical protein
LFFGSGAFAGIAASALIIRPLTVAANALTEFERPKMAISIADGQIDTTVASIRLFRLVLIVGWIATAAIAAVVLSYDPRLIFPQEYSLSFFVTGAVLWTIVSGMRFFRSPEIALLQAAGAFRPLALASVTASVVSIIGVIGFLAACGPLWSIAGVLLGETVFAGRTFKQARDWLTASRDKATIGATSRRLIVKCPYQS